MVARENSSLYTSRRPSGSGSRKLTLSAPSSALIDSFVARCQSPIDS
jgi:hypothetical protein